LAPNSTAFVPFGLNINTYKKTNLANTKGARAMSNKFEQLLELLINEENEKAEALFHEIVVEKSRDIYEGLADETTATEAKEESKEEAVEETKEETVEETTEESKDEEANEGEEVQIEDEKTEEETIEEVGGDATDELVKDIAADETGDAETAADDMEKDMGADAEEGDTEERVADLEDALDELKAEFEKMMSGKMGDEEGSEEEKEEESVAPVADPNAELSMEAKHDDKKKEKMDEYKIQKSADNKDHADNKKSPVANKNDMGGTTANIAKGGAEDKGRPAPTAQKMAGDFENTGGKDKSTSFKKEVKANTADGSDKSAKSPVAKA
jgi:hypothetical protein